VSKLYISLILFLSLLEVHAKTSTYKYLGRAYDSKSQLVYTEEHFEEWDEQNIQKVKTIYRDPEQKVIAEFHNDFTQSVKFPIVSFKDERTGEQHGTRLKDTQYSFYKKEDAQSSEQQQVYEKQDNSVAGQGFHFFIVSQLSSLKKGDHAVVDFAIPGRLTSYQFQYKVEELSSEEAVIKLFVNNLFLRMIAPSLTMRYSLKTKRLLEYNGLSNLKNIKGHTQKVKIVFDHP
jgi:hypothetical protein